jgi:hypothetical protein
MAKQTVVTLTDDLDPTIPADESIDFALDGKGFEIDLSTEHAEKLRDVLAPYIDAARNAGGGGHTHKPAKPGRHSADGESKLSRDESAAIRAWVRENGGEIKDRGRIPKTVAEAYRAGDTSAFKRDDKPEPAPEPEPVSAGIGAGGDPFATFTEPDHSVHF